MSQVGVSECKNCGLPIFLRTSVNKYRWWTHGQQGSFCRQTSAEPKTDATPVPQPSSALPSRDGNQGIAAENAFENVTRVEVIDHKHHTGRAFVHWEDDTRVDVCLQDRGRTL